LEADGRPLLSSRQIGRDNLSGDACLGSIDCDDLDWSSFWIMTHPTRFRPERLSDDKQWRSVVAALRKQLDDDDARHIEMQDALGGFIHQGALLIQRCIDEKGSRDVENAYYDWSHRAIGYMRVAIGDAFVERFEDASDWAFGDVPPGGYPSDRLGLYNDVRARTWRLEEFYGALIPRCRPVSELRRPPCW
jgi:hypothetical protein